MINELILNDLKKKYLSGTKVKLLYMVAPKAPPIELKALLDVLTPLEQFTLIGKMAQHLESPSVKINV